MIRLLTYIIVFVIPATSAIAYQCPLEAAYYKDVVFNRYENSDVVALIKPYKIEYFEQQEEYSSYKLIYVKILKSWKGNTNEIIIKDFNSPISGYLPLEKQDKYIIYGKKSDEGFYDVDTCDIENLGTPSKRQDSILEKVKSNQIKEGKHYEVFTKLEYFINHELIKHLHVQPIEKSIQINIAIEEYSPDWVAESIARFIEAECKSLGISTGTIQINRDNKTLTWLHPAD